MVRVQTENQHIEIAAVNLMKIRFCSSCLELFIPVLLAAAAAAEVKLSTRHR